MAFPPGLIQQNKNLRFAQTSKFWKWYLHWLDGHRRLLGSHDFSFALTDSRLQSAQFTRLELQVDALVLDAERIRWERLALGLDDFKGAQMDPSAVQAEPVENYELDHEAYVPASLVNMTIQDSDFESDLDQQITAVDSLPDADGTAAPSSQNSVQSKSSQNSSGSSGLSWSNIWDWLFGGRNGNGNNSDSTSGNSTPTPTPIPLANDSRDHSTGNTDSGSNDSANSTPAPSDTNSHRQDTPHPPPPVSSSDTTTTHDDDNSDPVSLTASQQDSVTLPPTPSPTPVPSATPAAHKKVWLKAFKRVRIKIDLRKFSFGGVTTAGDIVRMVASQKRPLNIKLKHVDGWLRIFSGQLLIAGAPAQECPTPAPNSDTTAPTVQVDSQSEMGLTAASSQLIKFSSNEAVTFSCSFDQGSWNPCSRADDAHFGEWSQNNIADGSHQLSVRAQDLAGNASEVLNTQWTVDTKAPALSLQSVEPIEPITNLNTMQILFQSDEAAQFMCSLDGSEAIACQSPLTLSDLSDGSHQLTLFATDLVGHTSSALTYQWRVQTIPPSVDLTQISPAISPTASNAIAFEFQGQDNAVSYLCRIDNGSASTCTSPVQFAELTDGAHSFDVRAVDVLGQIGAPASYSWSVDTLAPEVFMVSVLPTKNLTAETTIQLTFAASETATYRCSVDSGPIENCQSPFYFESLSEGHHIIRVQATDTAGNKAASPLEYAWVVDRTPPKIIALEANPQGSVINQTNISLNFTADEISRFECKLDGGDFKICTSPITYSGLLDGNHVVNVRAQDEASNIGFAQTYSFQIDTLAPLVTILSSEPATLITQDRNRKFSFQSPEENVSFECRLDGGAFNKCASPISYSQLTDGPHSFQVRARDLAGNITASPATSSWTVDATAPETNLLSHNPQASPTDSTSAVFEFSASEPNARFECQRDNAAFTACTSPYALNNLADGTHTFQVRAIDEAGNIDPTPISYSWQIDTTPLLISGVQVTAITTSSATVTWVTNKPASSQVQFTDVATGATVLTPVSATLKTSHSVQLTGLGRYTLYNVTAISQAATGSPTKSSSYSFRTAR